MEFHDLKNKRAIAPEKLQSWLRRGDELAKIMQWPMRQKGETQTVFEKVDNETILNLLSFLFSVATRTLEIVMSDIVH